MHLRRAQAFAINANLTGTGNSEVSRCQVLPLLTHNRPSYHYQTLDLDAKQQMLDSQLCICHQHA